ncbi:uncharacterized protein LOC122669437 isoform X1 [Telopea speciosissima]|uniref:uncharacterized protein LOC122669437 isoform X1 n=1 Tax=Telopea speciosissima TaxID=54955 RepID=UPI001CC50427|nr:uncharacterized protein LOC122669437 isoform X1 [Telopea speciosissima]
MSSLTPWRIPTKSQLCFPCAASSPSSNHSKYHSNSLPSYPNRLICRCQNLNNDLKFILHDALDDSGIDTKHARMAREGFCSQIRRLSNVERETSICINRGVDLAKTALHIDSEDDSLVSHSSVPLPIDSFMERLDDLSMGYCSRNGSSFRLPPEEFLACLERYLYFDKGFQRTDIGNQSEPWALYLHSVLTHRSGSAVMLSLIYSEVVKMLRLWGFMNFDVEIYFPHDLVSLPKGYHKQKSKASDQPHIMTTQSLLVAILRDLKEAFWPFQYDRTRSLFLRAAYAANCIDGRSIAEESGFELASAKAAQHRLDRGVWTSVRYGDMRRALSACEHLILLDFDSNELRDYSILLYHCGLFKESLSYLQQYQSLRDSSIQEKSSTTVSNMEKDAVEKLMVRLNLISMEEGWSRPPSVRSIFSNNSEPW